MSRRTDPAEVLRLIDALYDPLIARGETATISRELLAQAA